MQRVIRQYKDKDGHKITVYAPAHATEFDGREIECDEPEQVIADLKIGESYDK